MSKVVLLRLGWNAEGLGPTIKVGFQILEPQDFSSFERVCFKLVTISGRVVH